MRQSSNRCPLLRRPDALTRILNDVSRTGKREPGKQWIVVLDDYHAIEASEVHEAVTFLLDHLPDQLHLVMATRSDPPLPLARLRSRGQLNEVRTADLRFTSSEAREFLNQVMGLELTAADVDALENRTEGWIAGLQLAALSLRGIADRDEVTGFISAFTGSNRFVIDYLADEVLARQPAQVRDFLLRTAILDRLSGPLCDAVTGGTDGTKTLQDLERDNLFVVPLDTERSWYRYHHLFADVLHARLLAEHPEQVTGLHQRASGWYAAHGMVADAVRHALAAEDFDRAAYLMEEALPELRRSRQDGLLLLWMRSLPEPTVAPQPRPQHHLQLVAADVRGPRRSRIEARRRGSGAGRRRQGPRKSRQDGRTPKICGRCPRPSRSTERRWRKPAPMSQAPYAMPGTLWIWPGRRTTFYAVLLAVSSAWPPGQPATLLRLYRRFPRRPGVCAPPATSSTRLT